MSQARWPLRLLACALAVGAVLVACGRPAVAPVPRAPVVVISIDTLRADRLPVYGYDAIATPALDRLAADAFVFTRCLAHSPQTLPSHASLLTGRLPLATGVRDNVGFRLEEPLTTLSEELKGAGYRTGGFVSSYVLRDETGIAQGFDVWDDEADRPGPQVGLGAVQRPGPETVARALAWLDTLAGEKPFFLFVHLYEPHTPYAPPAHLKGRYQHPYDGEIVAADEAVSTLIQGLKARDLYRPATVVLLSDHGEGLGDHGEAEHGLFLYEEAVRVPLFIKPPGSTGNGRRVGGLTGLVDLKPTLLELSGQAPPDASDGLSLVAAMSAGEVPPRTIYGEALYGRYHFGWSELYSLTDERFRLIHAPRPELYDHDGDPGEQTNVYDRHPVARQRLDDELDRHLAGAALQMPADVSAEEADKLAALGYVGSGALADLAGDADGGDLPDPKDRVHILTRYKEALGARKGGDLDRAADLLGGLLSEEPRMADAWESLARLELERRRYEAAVAAAERLAVLAPERPGTHLLLARACLKARRHDDAAAAAARAVPADPGRAHELLSRIRLEQGRMEAALEHAGEAIAADPARPLPHFVRGLAAARDGRLEEALTHYRQAQALLAAKEHVELRGLHMFTGDALARLGRVEEAEVELKKEVALEPGRIQPRLKLAALYKSEGRAREAVAVVAEMAQVVRTPGAYAAAARALVRLGEPDGARALIDAGRTAFPGDAALRALAEGS